MQNEITAQVCRAWTELENSPKNLHIFLHQKARRPLYFFVQLQVAYATAIPLSETDFFCRRVVVNSRWNLLPPRSPLPLISLFQFEVLERVLFVPLPL